tara:strand:+ start:104 stop:586 length:483 start_codon:yes stop_codon:yes gene_type:complete
MSEASDWLQEVKAVVEKGSVIAPEISSNLSTHLNSYETVLEILSRPPEEVSKVVSLLTSVTGSQPVPTPQPEAVTPPPAPEPQEIDPLVAQAIGSTPAGLGGGGNDAPPAALQNWMQTSGVSQGTYDDADMKSSGMRKSANLGDKSPGGGSPQKLTRVVE